MFQESARVFRISRFPGCFQRLLVWHLLARSLVSELQGGFWKFPGPTSVDSTLQPLFCVVSCSLKNVLPPARHQRLFGILGVPPPPPQNPKHPPPSQPPAPQVPNPHPSTGFCSIAQEQMLKEPTLLELSPPLVIVAHLTGRLDQLRLASL